MVLELKQYRIDVHTRYMDTVKGEKILRVETHLEGRLPVVVLDLHQVVVAEELQESHQRGNSDHYYSDTHEHQKDPTHQAPNRIPMIFQQHLERYIPHHQHNRLCNKDKIPRRNHRPTFPNPWVAHKTE